MAGSVRMADIAERLGISVVSVSKGLSGKDGVSSELRSRILATAREMGYVDAKRARELMPAQNIGILVADRFFNENAFYYNLYRDLLTFSQEQNLAVLLEIVTNEAEWACRLPSLVNMNRVHGLILMGEFSMPYVQAVTGCGLPFVLLDSSKDDLEADSVVSDNVRGGYKLTRYLMEQGRKKIGFVGSIVATHSIMERYLGYCKALFERGMQPNPQWRLEDRNDTDGMFVPIVLPQDMPDAFVCSCDEIAYNLCGFLQARDIRVPEDVAVTGYDDFRFATLCKPNLTTYAVNVRDMARNAIEVLARRMAGDQSSAQAYVVPGRIILRAST